MESYTLRYRCGVIANLKITENFEKTNVWWHTYLGMCVGMFSNMPMNRKLVCKPLLPPHSVSLLRYRLCLPPCSHTAKYKEAPGLAWKPWAVLLSLVNTLLIMVPLLSLCCSLTFLTLQSATYGTWQLMNKKVPLFVFFRKAAILYVYILFFKEII